MSIPTRIKAPKRLQHHLQRGGLVAYPTESCYGIGCLPAHQPALRRLIRLKKRPQHKGMIVIGAHKDQLRPLLKSLPAATENMLAENWPAAKTFLLPVRRHLPPLLRGKGRTKLAVRVPDHAGARSLCSRLQTALVSTSCNRAGKRACKSRREVWRQFGRDVWIIGGQIGRYRQPSQIIDGETGRRLR